MISIDDMTIFAVNGADGTNRDWVNLLAFQQSKVNFSEVILFSHIDDFSSEMKNCGIRLEYIPPLDYSGYGEFCIYGLKDRIYTGYSIGVQLDGFIVNEDLWTDEFLAYDYIGAPWSRANLEWSYSNFLTPPPGWTYEMGPLMDWNVGNSGFCLRSRKFIEEIAKLPKEDVVMVSNDAATSITHRGRLESVGIKYADAQTACEFSVEAKHVENCVIPEQSF